jgi:hypothetical protein
MLVRFINFSLLFLEDTGTVFESMSLSSPSHSIVYNRLALDIFLHVELRKQRCIDQWNKVTCLIFTF